MTRFLRATSALVAAAACAILGQSPATADPGPVGVERATGYYVALGDSLGAGYQPGQGVDLTGGYVGGVADAIRTTSPKTRLVNLSCSGERATTLVLGGPYCSYAGSQLDAALAFLHRHGGLTRQVSIDIGANDVQRCVSRTSGQVDTDCVAAGLADVARYLPQVLAQLRSAAPNASILVLNYYNPFLAASLLGPAGQALAAQSSQLQGVLNTIIATSATANGAQVVDIAAAFQSTDTTPTAVPGLGTVPRNVAMICTYTWMCTLGDIHANDAGYALMAQTIAAVIP